MKKQVLFASFALIFGTGILLSCKEQSPVDVKAKSGSDEKLNADLVKNQTSITFERDMHDFAEIIKGEKVSTEFKFMNTGKNDLLISDAHGSCGCTVPEWPKEPIPPGGSGVIKVVFNSGNRSGEFNKTVTVIANTVTNPNKLIIKGTIITPTN